MVLLWHALLWLFTANSVAASGPRHSRSGPYNAPPQQNAQGLGGRYNRWRNEISPPPPPPRATPMYEHIARHPNPRGLANYLTSNAPHTMPVGVDRQHNMIRTKPETSLCWIAPARAMGGKSASGTVPIMIEHNGPVVAASLRMEMFYATAAMRSIYGNIYVIDFDGRGVPVGAEEKRWSVLVGSEDLDRALLICDAWVQSATIINSDGPPSADSAHFTNLASILLAVLVHKAAVECNDFRSVHSIVAAGNKDMLTGILGELAQWPDRRAHDLLAGVLNQPEEREFGSILTTLNTTMRAYSTEAALRTTDNPNLDLAEFVKGDPNAANPYLWHTTPDVPGKGRADTVYINRGPKKYTASIMVAFMTAVIEARRELYQADRLAGTPDAHSDLLIAQDEAANMPLPQLPELLAAPGEGVLITANLQDSTQLVKWGHMGKSMLTQFQQLTVFRGIRDNDLLSLIEGLCPTLALERIVPNHNNSDQGPTLTASASPERLPAITKAQIYSGINDDPTVVLYLGADGKTPDWIHIRPYYADPVLLFMQVATLELLAKWLAPDDPRRLLPLPNLDADGSGRALRAAGGPELLERYHAARAAMRPSNPYDSEVE